MASFKDLNIEEKFSSNPLKLKSELVGINITIWSYRTGIKTKFGEQTVMEVTVQNDETHYDVFVGQPILKVLNRAKEAGMLDGTENGTVTEVMIVELETKTGSAYVLKSFDNG